MSAILRFSLGVLFLIKLLAPISYQASVEVNENRALVDYPEKITFYLQASSSEEIESVKLVFGTDAISCGENITRAIPEDYESSKEVDVEWEFVLRRSGTLPPGTDVWWVWKLTDSSGNQTETPRQSLQFIDDTFDWQLHQSESLDFHWYEGSAGFIRELAQAGETALSYLFDVTGVKIQERMSIYIYEDSAAMQTATLFAPDWSGGIAFSEYRTVLASVPPGSITWGKNVVAHELTHVLVGVYTFSCVESMPIWLNEGLAMLMEESVGITHDSEMERLAKAIEDNDLLSVKEISYIFSNDPDLARQAYAQSLSLVEFLFETYGQEKMLQFLDKFKQGISQDRALKDVYGYDQDSLNAAWREWIGAPPLVGTPIPESTPTWTPYPTFAPISGPVVFDEETPTSTEPLIPTIAPTTPVPEQQSTYDDGNNFFIYVGIGGGAIILFLIFFFVLRRSKKIGA